MTVEPGQALLHYQLVDKLGEGGMGEVWRAEDTSLGRQVAIKVLPAGVADTADRLARFEREARLLATLNHPNIAAIYGLHEADGVRFLAMELVEGEDLACRLSRGPLSVEDALEVARSVASALREAHANGVIHRDLKPANIQLGVDGTVKVLDFGLAKALSTDGEGSMAGSPSLSPTVTSLGTVAGVLLGTAAYMSPEQARGRPVDGRADVWAFGCVLFEMLSGKSLFAGETITDTLAAVVRAEPDWSALPERTPRGVRRVLALCLAKDPGQRLHDVADAMLLIDADADELRAVPDDGATAAPAARPRERLGWMVALVALLLAFVGWIVALGTRSEGEADRPLTRFTITLPDEMPLAFVPEPMMAVSRDGGAVVFAAMNADVGRNMLYLRTLDEAEPWLLVGTEGATTPFFSPDGTQIGFFAEGTMKRLTIGGGSPVNLADAPNSRGGVWLEDDTIVFSPEYAGGMWRVPASGGTPRMIAEPDPEAEERTFRWPTRLPGDESVLITVGFLDSPNGYDDARVDILSLEDGSRRPLIEGANVAHFVGPDRLFYSRAGTLYGARFDPGAGKLVTEPIRVREGVGGDPSSGAGYYDISATGDLYYVPGSITDARARMILIDRDGNAEPLPMEPRGFHHPRFSPDGTQLAFTSGIGALGINGDIWVYELEDGRERRVTFAGGDVYPQWQPGGKRLAFMRSNATHIVSKAADGSGEANELVASRTEVQLPHSFDPDGKLLAMTRTGRGTDIYLHDLESGEETLFVKDASGPAISPDGRWLAYASPSAGRASVYVRALDGEGQWQASPTSGSYPRWSPDGRSLFYIDVGDPTRPLMEVEVLEGDSFRVGMPKVVIETLNPYVTTTAPLMNWDTDGDRFAFVQLDREKDTLHRLEVSLNWAESLALGSAR